MGGPGVFAKQGFFPFQNNEVQHILDVVRKKIYRGSCPGYEIQVLQVFEIFPIPRQQLPNNSIDLNNSKLD